MPLALWHHVRTIHTSWSGHPKRKFRQSRPRVWCMTWLRCPQLRQDDPARLDTQGRSSNDRLVVMRKTPPLEDNTAKSRTLKRTSSNASLASLPTPPRTIHKRKRSGSRASSIHDSGDESDASVSERNAVGKRRKVVHAQGVEAKEEELFWSGVTPPADKPSTSARPGPVTRSTTRSPEESPKIMTRTQYKESRSTTVTGLQSPPPSRRQPARKVKKPVTPQPLVAPRTPRTPRTPRAMTRSPGKAAGKGRSKATKELPIRDSPNNPFLDGEDGSKPLAPPRFKTPDPKAPVVPVEERKTVTYVFRGHRQELLNPLFGYKPSEQSKLPPEHPDFSPDFALPPKLLFPTTPTRRSLRSTTRGRSPSPRGDDRDIGPLMPRTPKKQLRFVGVTKEPRSPKKKAEVEQGSSSKESPVKTTFKGKVSLMDRTLEEKGKKGQASTATAATTSGKSVAKNKRL
ncbi:hypothetical protein BDM02DRAFT_3126180 [Thelephora ganbajun]|uniref:Uncharacterized protein n=1 Tax=Thelephora ganbajun TaxID=370292 RepID=A0ACB6ZSA2_THEGA|nr:hypothetical protein BDM02DRAFT_3126180 [Thelephora ganbajun]